MNIEALQSFTIARHTIHNMNYIILVIPTPFMAQGIPNSPISGGLQNILICIHDILHINFVMSEAPYLRGDLWLLSKGQVQLYFEFYTQPILITKQHFQSKEISIWLLSYNYQAYAFRMRNGIDVSCANINLNWMSFIWVKYPHLLET